MTDKQTEQTPWKELCHGFLMVFSISVGLMCLVDFLGAVDGILYYGTWREAFYVYPEIWLFNVTGGIAYGLAALAVGAIIAKLMRRRAAAGANAMATGLTFVLTTLALARGLKAWLAASGIPVFVVAAQYASQYKLYVAAITVTLCGIWIYKRGITAWRDHIPPLLTIPLLISIMFLLISTSLLIIESYSSADEVRNPKLTLNKKTDPTLPSVILISVDTFNAKHSSLYGYGRDTTPGLRAFGSVATTFERHYANSNFTTPTISSTLTGVLPWKHRALHLAGKPLAQYYSQSLLAEFHKAGYQTISVATNIWADPVRLGDKSYLDLYSQNNYPVCPYGAEGLLKHISPVANLVFVGSFPWKLPALIQNFAIKHGLCAKANHHDPTVAFDEAQKLVEQSDKTKPFFLWVHLLPPHDPYAAPEPFVGQFDPSSRARSRLDSSPPFSYSAADDADFPNKYVGRYDESLLYVDSHISKFLDWLKATGHFEKSIVAITADHGESFSHGYGLHDGPELYEDLLRIPLVIKSPGQRIPKRVKQISQQVDLLPTLIELAGIPRINKLDNIDGISLVPLLQDNPWPERHVLAMNFELSRSLGVLSNGSVAIIDGNWKYVYFFGNAGKSNSDVRNQLYDLSTDPGEENNLSDRNPEQSRRLQNVILGDYNQYSGAIGNHH